MDGIDEKREKTESTAEIVTNRLDDEEVAMLLFHLRDRAIFSVCGVVFPEAFMHRR